MFSYSIMQLIETQKVAPLVTLVQLGEASFARGGWEFEAQENRPFGRLSMDTSFCPKILIQNI